MVVLISITDDQRVGSERLRDVELRHLAALRAVADAGTFGRAADVLGYTQSAVSQQIASLERVLGGPLFDRPGGPKPVRLTPLGERLLGHARDVLARVAIADADVDAFLAGSIGTLSVGTFQSSSVRLLPGVIRQIKRERPSLELALTDTNDHDALVDGLTGGALDVSFLTNWSEDPRLDVSELLVDPFVLLSPLDTDLLPGSECVPADALDALPLIGEHDTVCQRAVEGSLAECGVKPTVFLRSVDNAAIRAMVASGMGHAVVPALAVDPASSDVLIRKLNPGIPPRVIYVATPADRTTMPATERFIELARAVAADVSPTLDWARSPTLVRR